MRHFTRSEIHDLPSLQRRHLINSVSGYKSVNLVSTLSADDVPNLAVMSSVIHIGATPPLQGFLMRPLTVERQTYEYIKAQGSYTINHVHLDWIDKAHQTSAKYPASISEYEACQLTPEYRDDFAIPYVKESKIKMGLSYVEEHPISANDTILIIGQIEHLYVQEEALLPDGNLDLSAVNDVAVSGLENYYKVEREAHFAFARPEHWPTNQIKQ